MTNPLPSKKKSVILIWVSLKEYRDDLAFIFIIKVFALNGGFYTFIFNVIIEIVGFKSMFLLFGFHLSNLLPFLFPLLLFSINCLIFIVSFPFLFGLLAFISNTLLWYFGGCFRVCHISSTYHSLPSYDIIHP